MFDSGITAAELIESIESEADIAEPISKENYVDWLNGVEQLLYSEVIQEQYCVTVEEINDDKDILNSLRTAVRESFTGLNPPQTTDIYAIFCDDRQLIQSTPLSYTKFPDTWSIVEGGIAANIKETPKTLRIYFFARPSLKCVADGGIVGGNVMIPVEFIELVKSRLRAEQYKFVNEDGIAAKWMNDYNAHLETFRAWVEKRRPKFGM